MADKPNPSTDEQDRRNGPAGESSGSGAASGAPSAGKSAAGSEKGNEKTGTGRVVKENVSLKSLSSLERLRDRVETAAHELKRLRDENQALSERIKELEGRPHVDPQGGFLSIEHDPELLRRKINGFIAAIDRYLESERNRQ